MPAIATYEKIYSSTASSDTAGFTFSTIPQTYTDLYLVIQEPNSSTGSNEHGLQFNSDIGNTSNTNYSYVGWAASGASNASRSNSGNFKYDIGGSIASETTLIRIFDYTNTSYYKGIQAEYQQQASGSTWTNYTNGTWKSTSAITSLRVDTFGSIYNYLFRTGTVATLYGIKAG